MILAGVMPVVDNSYQRRGVLWVTVLETPLRVTCWRDDMP